MYAHEKKCGGLQQNTLWELLSQFFFNETLVVTREWITKSTIPGFLIFAFSKEIDSDRASPLGSWLRATTIILMFINTADYELPYLKFHEVYLHRQDYFGPPTTQPTSSLQCYSPYI